MTGPTVKILIGDAVEKLKEIPSESVHCCICSPPYFGLRAYHRCQCSQTRSVDEKEWHGQIMNCGARTPRYKRDPDPNCPLCHGTGEIIGVKEKEIGSEDTPNAYVGRLVEVFREVRRVLRTDGVFWLNMGDTYAGSWGNFGHRADLDGGVSSQRSKDTEYFGRRGWDDHRETPPMAVMKGLPAKNLIGIPWRVALALQADGWILRSDVIWEKRGCTPESVTDRCSRNHEYLFMFAKAVSPTYWTHRDLDGTRKQPKPDYVWTDELTGVEYREKPSDFTQEAVTCTTCGGTGEIEVDDDWGCFYNTICDDCEGTGSIRRWSRVNLWKGHDYFYDIDAVREPLTFNRWSSGNKMGSSNKPIKPTPPGQTSSSFQRLGHSGYFRKDGTPAFNPLGRNKRTVWAIVSEPFPDAHFATFPRALVIDPIKATSSEKGCCPTCGAPYARITVKVRPKDWLDQGVQTKKELAQRDIAKSIYGGNQKSRSISDIYGRALKSGIKQLGWKATCSCRAGDPVPCTILDPFAGSGTVGAVARTLDRSSIMIELNPTYEALIRKRTMSSNEALIRKRDLADIAAIESFGGK